MTVAEALEHFAAAGVPLAVALAGGEAVRAGAFLHRFREDRAGEVVCWWQLSGRVPPAVVVALRLAGWRRENPELLPCVWFWQP